MKNNGAWQVPLSQPTVIPQIKVGYFLIIENSILFVTLFRWSVFHFSEPFVRKRDQIFASLVILEYNDRVGNGKFVGSTSFWISRFFRVFPSQDRKPSSLMTSLPWCTSIVLSNKWRIMGSTPSVAYSVNIRLSSSHYRLISFQNSAVLQF